MRLYTKVDIDGNLHILNAELCVFIQLFYTTFLQSSDIVSQ